jgi:hypothetical protein
MTSEDDQNGHVIQMKVRERYQRPERNETRASCIKEGYDGLASAHQFTGDGA